MFVFFFFFFNDTATTEIYTLSLHDALPISGARSGKSSYVLWQALLSMGSAESILPGYAPAQPGSRLPEPLSPPRGVGPELAGYSSPALSKGDPWGHFCTVTVSVAGVPSVAPLGELSVTLNLRFGWLPLRVRMLIVIVLAAPSPAPQLSVPEVAT